MIRLKQPVILNAKGEPVTLTQRELHHANWTQRQVNERFENDLGAEVNITTLTTIVKRVSEQKFFEIPPADFVPVRVGEGAWSTNLLTYRSFAHGEDFETGIIDTGANNTRLATADASVDSVPVVVKNWAKAVGWSIFDLEFAAKAGNWDLVTAKEKARKTNWDLGIQRIAFLGAKNNPKVLGLYTQVGVTVDTTLITAPISSLSTADLKDFCAKVIERYRDNVDRTAWPTHFVIPESDYNGMASQSSPDFPIKSVLAVLEETFQLITRNKEFKILPCAYGDKKYNAGWLNGTTGEQVYALYRYEEDSIRMDLPVDYTNTLANSLDNFNYQNAAFGQFTGVMTYRPKELMYFKY